MASCGSYLIAVFLMALSISASAIPEAPSSNRDIVMAMQEMQQANYFTFVMLINMVEEKIPLNTTFLMPSDRMLSGASIPENQVMEFLLRHSIPSPLLFDDIKRLPNGTLLPAYQPYYLIRITNKGRKRFFCNNVHLVSPDICTAGDSFRCHGIHGVLRRVMPARAIQPNCFPPAPPTALQPLPAPIQPPPSSHLPGTAPAISPSPGASADSPQQSSSTILQFRGSYATIVSFLIFSVTKF